MTRFRSLFTAGWQEEGVEGRHVLEAQRIQPARHGHVAERERFIEPELFGADPKNAHEKRGHHDARGCDKEPSVTCPVRRHFH